MAVMPRAEFEALSGAADHAGSIAAYRSGILPGLSLDQTRAYVEAASPLAFWRSYRGLTQSSLAGAAGIAQNYLSELENGKRSGSVEIWLKLSRALNLPVEHLVDAD